MHGVESCPDAARHEVTNSQLRANLGYATATIRAKRLAVVSELPDWEQLRTYGETIKTAAMSMLPELLEQLEQLEEKVVANGGQVH